jgi:RNA polymerase sigma factor (sigma-70 family)
MVVAYSDNINASDPQQICDYLQTIRGFFINRALRNGFDRNFAEDSFQEVAYRTLRALSEGLVFEDTESIRRWTYRVHHNYCIEAVRKKKPVNLGEMDLELPAPEVEELLDRRELTDKLSESVRNLPDHHREAIEGLLEGKSYDEIARETNRLVTTTSVRIHRAKATLKLKLRKFSFYN